MPTDTPRDMIAPAVGRSLLPILLAAAAGASIVMMPAKIQLGLLAAAAFAWVLSWIHGSQRPRPLGLHLVAVIMGVFTFSAFPLGPGISVVEVAPFAALLVTYVPRVAAPAVQRQVANWLVAVPVIMVIGGVMAATAPGANLNPILSFALTAVPTVLMLHRLRPSRDEAYELVLGLVGGVVASTAAGLLVSRGASGRAVGFTAQSNQYAMSAVFALPLLWLLVSERRLKPAAGMIVGLVLVGGVLESGSRSGLLAMFGTLLLLGIRRFGLATTLSVGGVFGLLLLLIGPWLALGSTPTFARVSNPAETAQSNTKRLDYMGAEFDALTNGNYVFGTGIVENHLPHNLVLLVWGGMGIVGLLAFGTVLTVVFRRALSSDPDPYLLGLSVAIVGFLLALALNNLIGAPIFWATVSLLMFTAPAPPQPRKLEESRSTKPVHTRSRQ